MHCPNCRAALPAGSLFCNRCGASMQAASNRTQALPPQPQRTVHGQPAPHTQTHYGAAPGFNPDRTQSYLPPPLSAEAPRKPVWLLALILALVIGGVAGGTVALVKSRQSSVLSGKTPNGVISPGVTQSSTPGMPEGPGVHNSRPGAPGQPGQPVTSTPGKPGSDMAPPLVMSEPGKPGAGPSVTQVPTVSVPGAPITQAPVNTAPSARPVTQNPSAAPAPPRDNSDFNRYLQWLQYVENERKNLRAMGETQAFAMMEGYLNALIGLADPDVNENMAAATMERRAQETFQRTLLAIRTFQVNIQRTKPPVPSDCRALDSYYTAAALKEAEATQHLVAAMSRKDIGTIKSVGRSAVGEINSKLGQANLELERVYRGRGLNPLFKIDAGGGSSMLDGLTGLGGLR